MSTYGIDESKSRIPIYPASQVYTKTEVYNKTEAYSKSEVYNKTEADEKFLTQTAGAPKNHASTASTYGLGTSSNYGHVKLTTSTAAPSGDQSGLALAGSMGYTLKKYTDDSIAALGQVQLPVGFFLFVKNQSDIDRIGYGNWTYRGYVTTTFSPTGIGIHAYERTS